MTSYSSGIIKQTGEKTHTSPEKKTMAGSLFPRTVRVNKKQRQMTLYILGIMQANQKTTTQNAKKTGRKPPHPAPLSKLVYNQLPAENRHQ